MRNIIHLEARADGILAANPKNISFNQARVIICSRFGESPKSAQSYTSLAYLIGHPGESKTTAKKIVATYLYGKGYVIKKRQKTKKRKKKVIRKKKTLEFVQTNDFLVSFEWRRARYIKLKGSDGKCQLCGRSKHDDIILNIDHIKPRKTHPELALTQSNLQCLCHDCNHGKGNIDDTDWQGRH